MLNRRIQIVSSLISFGDSMGDCELCGAMKISTREVKTGKATVMACMRCSEKFDVQKKAQTSFHSSNKAAPKRRTNNIMNKGDKELRQNFGKFIQKTRKKMNMTHQQLARKMAETVNVIKAAESGKRPTDAVISKFEKILEIELMVESNDEHQSLISSSKGRGLTLGDYLSDIGE